MPRALLSVYDKTLLIEFAQGLHVLGWELLASGSTAKTLREYNLPVTEVADYTKSPEMLGGRVKTLHPAIHGGLLARATETDRNELLKCGWDYIDLVAVNLYPFAVTIAQINTTEADAIEQIDIGGVTLIRAAAKNFSRVTLVCDPQDYLIVLNELKNGGTDINTRKKLAIKGFQITSHYDQTIANYFSSEKLTQLTLYPVQTLRYGENPHQTATLLSYTPNTGPLGGTLLQGKELSYNNLLDLDAAWRTVISFTKPTVCIVKHVSPCGIASAGILSKAFQLALASDPISAFGGIIASNKPFDVETANALDKLFVECIVAPHFTDEARSILNKRQNCRLLEIPFLSLTQTNEYRSIANGLLQQSFDLGDPDTTQWKIASEKQPSEEQIKSLTFAWRVCQHVKSNAIVLVQDEATIGIGGGQPNRIDCVRMAIERGGNKVIGSVMASDAFFPFSDCVEMAAKYSISAIIHPGGSIRDQEVITKANELGLVMIITGVRHFRH